VSPPFNDTPFAQRPPAAGGIKPVGPPQLTPSTAFDRLQLISPGSTVGSPPLNTSMVTPRFTRTTSYSSSMDPTSTRISPSISGGTPDRSVGGALTLAEEAKLLHYFEDQVQRLCDTVCNWFRDKALRGSPAAQRPSFDIPIEVKATAICFLKRFFLHASLMEHDPHIIMVCCVAMAYKSEDFQLFATLEELLQAPAVAAVVAPAATDNVLNAVQEAELLLLQGTRLHLMLHHPYRPLKGWLAAVSEGCVLPAPDRVLRRAEAKVRATLHTDAVFVHSPSRLALAAIRSACREEHVDVDRCVLAQFRAVGMAVDDEQALAALAEIETRFFRATPVPSVEELNKDALWKRAQAFWSGAQRRKVDEKDRKVTKKSDKKRSAPLENIVMQPVGSSKKAKMVSFNVEPPPPGLPLPS